MATVYGNTVNDFWRAQLDYTVTETATQIKIAVTNKCHIVKKHTHNSQHDRPNYVSCDGVQKNFYPTWGENIQQEQLKQMEVVHSLSINNLPQEPSHLKYINITNDLIMVLLQTAHHRNP